jgi:hypothetical protein
LRPLLMARGLPTPMPIILIGRHGRHDRLRNRRPVPWPDRPPVAWALLVAWVQDMSAGKIEHMDSSTLNPPEPGSSSRGLERATADLRSSAILANLARRTQEPRCPASHNCTCAGFRLMTFQEALAALLDKDVPTCHRR